MKNKTAQNVDGVAELQRSLQGISSVAGQNLGIPPNILQAQDMNLVIDYLSNMDAVLKQLQAVVGDLSNNVYRELLAKRDLQAKMVQNQQQQLATTKGASTIFNLNKFSQFDGGISGDPFGDGGFATNSLDDDLGIEDDNVSPEELRFSDGSELKQWLDTVDALSAIETLTNIAGSQPISDGGEIRDPVEVIKGGVERFYRDNITEQEKLEIAMKIYDILPNSARVEQPDEGSVVEAPFEDVMDVVSKSNEDIKKVANKDASRNKKSSNGFNLKKHAQAGTVENVIMYGPEEKRIDPFSRQPASDWSVIERNKGFGLVVDDVWNIDWEALWRGNIMDKYSRPYRDNDGNWVGGYIQKRFEVDKWIPPETNLQLPPGQTRKQYLPGQGNIEERLETMRKEKAKERGYEPQSSGNPYNWKTASKKKVI